MTLHVPMIYVGPFIQLDNVQTTPVSILGDGLRTIHTTNDVITHLINNGIDFIDDWAIYIPSETCNMNVVLPYSCSFEDCYRDIFTAQILTMETLVLADSSLRQVFMDEYKDFMNILDTHGIRYSVVSGAAIYDER